MEGLQICRNALLRSIRVYSNFHGTTTRSCTVAWAPRIAGESSFNPAKGAFIVARNPHATSQGVYSIFRTRTNQSVLPRFLTNRLAWLLHPFTSCPRYPNRPDRSVARTDPHDPDSNFLLNPCHLIMAASRVYRDEMQFSSAAIRKPLERLRGFI